MSLARDLYKHRKKSIIVLCILCLPLFLHGCGGESPAQRQAQQEKIALDSTISQAQGIGVPQSFLQPVLEQEQQLETTAAPLPLFSSQATETYYHNITKRYQLLTLQIRGIEAQSTQQLGYQAALDIQSFENALTQRQNQGFIETQAFANQLTQDQALLDQAQYPKHFLEISNSAKNATLALHLMGPTNDQLTTLHNLINQLDDSGLDVTALRQQEQDDLAFFQQASGPDDFRRLISIINAQLQAATTLSTQATPYVGQTRLRQLSTDIVQMQHYQIDTSIYQQQFERDSVALNSATTLSDYLRIASQIDSDLTAARLPLLRGEANYLLQQYYQEVNTWGASHRYHDAFNGQKYNLDYEYDEIHGFGSELDSAVQNAQTPDDYQAAIDQINTLLLHLKAMEADANDKTAYTQPHTADLQLLQHYKLEAGSAIVVSLVEQTLRFYQDGKLVKAFFITSGQYERPTPPGLWQIFVRQSPMIFKSWEPKGSAFWYPNTNITYAMEYRNDGYYFHDSWWRQDYGPGTNFPHLDSGGDQEFAGSGSHGCINMSQELAGWLYQNTTYGTAAIIY